MRLTRVEIEGAGRFGTRTRLEGLGPGVNVLAAENEAGKSTIFRAIRSCLFERHGTKNTDVAALASEGLSLPVTVSLGLDHGGVSYEITKSFLRSPRAELRKNGVVIARDRDADESLWDLLGIAPGSGRSVDDAAYGILWVNQGHSFKAPELTAAGASVLNAAIQQEVGTLVGGERARQVLAQLADDLKNTLTENGKPRKGSALEEATSQLATLTAELAEAEQRLAQLDTSLDELARLRSQHRKLVDPVDAAALKQEYDEAARQFKSAEEAAALLRRHEDEERNSLALLKAHDDNLESLRERCRRLDGNRHRHEDLAPELSGLAEEEQEARRRLAAILTDLRKVDDQSAGVDDEDRRLQRLAALVQHASSREGLAARLHALQSYEQRASAIAAALKANGVDAEAIDQLGAVEREQVTLAARLQAAAAQLSIQRLQDEPVSVNGEEVATGMTRAVTEPLTILVGNAARITVLPPEKDAEAAKAQEQKLRHRLRQLLDAHGAATPAELRKMREARLALEADARSLKDTQAALGLKAAAATPDFERIAGEIARIDSEKHRVLTDIGAETLPAAEEIAAAQAALSETRAALRAGRAGLDAAASQPRDILARSTGRQSEIKGQLAVIAAQIAADLEVLPDDRRAAILEAATAQRAATAEDHRRSAEAAATLRHSAPGPEAIEQLRNRADRLSEALQNRRHQIGALGEKIANLEGQIQTAGGDGLGEKAADLRARKDLAGAERDRQSERVATLQLLHDVVKQRYEKRREELNAPLRRHLKPFLHDLFPRSEIELGDGFAVTGLRRAGPSSERFTRLSAGTQEQIAVLVRLAMGAMLAERGNEVPVILDDALVFSDDARIEQMFDALNRAGRNQQVIVFTCRARSFASLGGRQLSIT
jgi:DNA repair exonuclease SbcCD ATPase subunit